MQSPRAATFVRVPEVNFMYVVHTSCEQSQSNFSLPVAVVALAEQPKGLFVDLLNDGQGWRLPKALATRHVLRASSPQRFIETHRFETFLAGSRITQCAKKRDACQGQRQDSPQLAAQQLNSSILVAYDSSASTGAHSSMHSNSQSGIELNRVMSSSYRQRCLLASAPHIVLIYNVYK